MSTTSVAYNLQHHALLLAPQRNQSGAMRNRAAGEIEFYRGNKTFSILLSFYSGTTGVNQMEEKIISNMNKKFKIRLSSPSNKIQLGTTGQNVHTEAGLAIIAKRLIGFNRSLQRINLQIFTEKAPCNNCLVELQTVHQSPSIKYGSINLYTSGEDNQITEVPLSIQ